MAHGWTRREMLLTVCTAFGAGSAGCLGQRTTDEDGTTTTDHDPDVQQTIDIVDETGFEPARVEIQVGETVEWVNTTPPRQSVTASEDDIPAQRDYFASGSFGRELTARIVYPFAGGLNQDDRYTHTFETAGTYRYFSIPTETDGTTGTIRVRD